MSRYRIVLVVEVDAAGVEIMSAVSAATSPLSSKKYEDDRNTQPSYGVDGTQVRAPRIASFEVVEAKKL